MKKIVNYLIAAIVIIAIFFSVAYFWAGEKTSIHLYFWGLFIAYLIIGDKLINDDAATAKSRLLNVSAVVTVILLLTFTLMHFWISLNMSHLRWSIFIAAMILNILTGVNTTEIGGDMRSFDLKKESNRMFFMDFVLFIALTAIVVKMIVLHFNIAYSSSIYYTAEAVVCAIMVSILVKRNQANQKELDLWVISILLILAGTIFVLLVAMPTLHPELFNADIAIPFWIFCVCVGLLVYPSLSFYLAQNKEMREKIKEMQ